MSLHNLSHITQKYIYTNMHAAHSCPQTERETHKVQLCTHGALTCMCSHVPLFRHILSHTHTHACRTQKYSHRYIYMPTQTTSNTSVHTLTCTAAPAPKHMQLGHMHAHSCTSPGTPYTQTYAGLSYMHIVHTQIFTYAQMRHIHLVHTPHIHSTHVYISICEYTHTSIYAYASAHR